MNRIGIDQTEKTTPVGDDRVIQTDSTDSNTTVWSKITNLATTIFGLKTTTNLTEGSNLYYTDARVNANTEVIRLEDEKADKTNVLELDNTTAFTPDADYEPATKKYTDDSITTAVETIRLVGGDGSDGVLNISSGTTTLTLVDDFIEKNYSSITISGTALLDITGVDSIGGIAIIKCAGDFTMSAGTIDITGQGGEGGIAENNGCNGRNAFGIIQYGSGGTSGIQSGGNGIKGPAGVYALGSPTGFTSGGGGGGGEINTSGTIGGRGGGILIIEIGGSFNFTGGTIQSNGDNGGDQSVSGGGGGGGGGGTIVVLYNTLTSNTGTIQCNGGDGGYGLGVGTNGGGGGGGYSDGGDGSEDSSTAGTNGTTNTWGDGGTGGALPNGGGGGGAGLYIVQDFNTL